MTITNGGFELGDGGQATGWTHTTLGQLLEYAPFAATPVNVGYDSFDWLGDLADEYAGLLVDLDPAIFESGPGQELFEDFEEGWGATGLITTLSQELADFDTTPQDFEDFEEEWGDFIFTWGPTLEVSEVTFADFDTTPQDFEDFEDDWGLTLPQAVKASYPSWISGADLEAATFDNTGGGGGAADEYEPFVDTAWPTLTL
jgi:hypothetical protein